MEIWHKRIKELRENTDVTLKDMAKIIGVSEATVQRYECGKIYELPYKVIESYAEKFNVSPSYIMGWDNSSEIKLSSDEENIIIEYRKLNKNGKQQLRHIIEYAKGLSDDNNIQDI